MRSALVPLLCALLVVAFAVLITVKSSPTPAWTVTPDAGATNQAADDEAEPDEKPFDRTTPYDEQQKAQEARASAAESMSMADLLNLPDDDMMAEVTQRLLQKRAEVGIEHMPQVEQRILRAEALGIRLAHDGFMGFWLSPWANDYQADVEALQETKATMLLPLLTRTLIAFPNGVPPDDLNAREKVLESLVQDGLSPFEELDRQAAELLPKHAEAVAQFTRAHAAELQLPPRK